MSREMLSPEIESELESAEAVQRKTARIEGVNDVAELLGEVYRIGEFRDPETGGTISTQTIIESLNGAFDQKLASQAEIVERLKQVPRVYGFRAKAAELLEISLAE